MVFSKSCYYAIRSLIYMAARDSGDYVQIREISANLNISFHFLTKSLRKLSHAGYLITSRGAAGGVKFAVDPAKLSLMDIVIAVDGPGLFENCILGLPGCGIKDPCPLHDRWTSVADDFKRMLNRTKIRELADQFETGNIRIGELVRE